MGTDAVFVSTKKRIACNIDRLYNVSNDGDYDVYYDLTHDGVPVFAAVVFVAEIIALPLEGDDDRPDLYETRQYWLNRALGFFSTLDKDDIITLRSDDTDEWLDYPRWEPPLK